MTKEEEALEWNFVVATYVGVRDRTKQSFGSVGIIEAMLKYAKSLELCVQESFSSRSIDTVFEIDYRLVSSHQP